MGGCPEGVLFRRSSVVFFFSANTHGKRLAEELNPTSWTPLFVSFASPRHDFSASVLRLFSRLLCWCIQRVTFASLVFSSAPSRISSWVLGALLIATKDLPCSVRLCSYKYTYKNLIGLLWFCPALTRIWIFLLFCVIMLSQIYANVWKVWILMLLHSCSACVALPGVSLWSCQSGTCLAGDRGGSSANSEHGA